MMNEIDKETLDARWYYYQMRSEGNNPEEAYKKTVYAYPEYKESLEFLEGGKQ